MKCGQSTKYNVRKIFSWNHAENEVKRLFPNLFLFSVRSSVRPSVRAFFLNFGMVLEPIWSCAWQSWIFCKKCFCPKIWKSGPKMGQKQGFLNLLKDLVVNFYWICSILKACIICCVPAQIQYLGKVLSLRYGRKCSQPIRLQDFFNQPYLQNRSIK